MLHPNSYNYDYTYCLLHILGRQVRRSSLSGQNWSYDLGTRTLSNCTAPAAKRDLLCINRTSCLFKKDWALMKERSSFRARCTETTSSCGLMCSSQRLCKSNIDGYVLLMRLPMLSVMHICNAASSKWSEPHPPGKSELSSLDTALL